MSKTNQNESKTLKKEGILNKQDVVNAYDKYLEKINEDPNPMNLNDYMSDILYELEDEEDLDVVNEAEEELRKKYNIDDIDIEEDDYYELEESKGPREFTDKFLTHIVDGLGVEEDSTAYNIIVDLCKYLSEDEVKDFVKQYGYDEEEYEEIYTPDASEIRDRIQVELSNDQRMELYNMYNVEEIEEWNDETQNLFWDWLDLLDSDELEEIEEDLNKMLNESKEVKTKGNYKADYFSGNDFEKKLPYEMRYKEYQIVNDSEDLYWVTQEFFGKQEIEQFKEVFKETPFEKAYVTVRDLSTYDFKKDLENDVLVVIDKEGNVSSSNYETAIKDYNYDFETSKWNF